jgi:hypothetical protein
MGMVKSEYIEHKIKLEDFEASLEWMTRYGVKTFKDHTGEWVEVRCSKEYNLFNEDVKPIPHEVFEYDRLSTMEAV